MTQKKWTILIIFSLFLLLWSLAAGSKVLSLNQIFQGVVYPESPSGILIWRFRMPRIILAILAGGLLATSGMILQITLKNELASPDIVGLNKASSFCIVLLHFFVAYPTQGEVVTISIIGSIFCALLLYFISRKNHFSASRVIISGVALSFFFDAAIKLLSMNNKQILIKQMLWITGSLLGRYWEMIPLLLCTTIFLIAFLMLTRQRLFLIQLDTSLFTTLGQNEKILNWLFIGVAAIVSGIAVSTVGAIGFIGLIAPHISRQLLPIYTAKRFLVTFYIGGIILLLADLVGRSLFGVIEVPAGIVVSLIGGPYFLFMLLQQRKWRKK